MTRTERTTSNAKAPAGADLQNPDITALFVDALNQMSDIRTRRVTVGVSYHIPPLMWAALSALTIFASLGVGYLFGMAGQAKWLLALVLVPALATVIALIVDLDRSGARRAGLIKVSQQPTTDLQQWIHEQMGPE